MWQPSLSIFLCLSTVSPQFLLMFFLSSVWRLSWPVVLSHLLEYSLSSSKSLRVSVYSFLKLIHVILLFVNLLSKTLNFKWFHFFVPYFLSSCFPFFMS
jgi:hypothetical protein